MNCIRVASVTARWPVAKVKCSAPLSPQSLFLTCACSILLTVSFNKLAYGRTLCPNRQLRQRWIRTEVSICVESGSAPHSWYPLRKYKFNRWRRTVHSRTHVDRRTIFIVFMHLYYLPVFFPSDARQIWYNSQIIELLILKLITINKKSW